MLLSKGVKRPGLEAKERKSEVIIEKEKRIMQLRRGAIKIRFQSPYE